MRLGNILAAVALLLAAGGLAGVASRQALPASVPNMGVAIVVPVPPPPGARRSPKAFGPLETVGSSFLHETVGTYTAPMTDVGLYAYYAKRLDRLGYKTSSSGYSCTGAGRCESFWMFAKDVHQDDSVVLSVRPEGKGSLFSVARELVVLPPRPEASLVPADVQRVVLKVQVDDGPAWATRTVTEVSAIRRLREIVNGLTFADLGSHGPCWPNTRTATVTLMTPYADYAFRERPCGVVMGPGGVTLGDGSAALWRAVTQLAGVSAQN